MIVPLVGCKSVVSILIVVDLPAPFGPKNAKISPFLTSKEMSFTAVKSPNRLTKFLTSMMFSIVKKSSRLGRYSDGSILLEQEYNKHRQRLTFPEQSELVSVREIE